MMQNTPREGEERRSVSSAAPQPSLGSMNACLSNTHSLNRQIDENQVTSATAIRSAVASVDWYEIGGQVLWDEDDSEYEFQKLEHVLQRAQENRNPEPWTIAGKTVLVHPGGLGSGRQSRMRYRIEWGSVLIGVSDRESTTRKLSNFYFKASGDPCLLVGMQAILDFQHAVIESLGGMLNDSWLKRLDLCLDLPEMSVKDELVPAYLENRFVTSSSAWGAYAGPHGPTGFSFGSKTGVRLNIYDKLHEVKSKGPDYQQAMVQYRWGKSWPEAAIRVEYQIRKPWLDQYSILTATGGLERLRDIIGKVTSEGPRPFVRFTSTPPDRENGHQGRAETLPQWSRIIAAFLAGVPESVRPLERMNRRSITNNRAFSFIRGYLTKAAAIGGVMIGSLADALEFLKELHQGNWSTDEEWQSAWERHAMKLGTIDIAKQVRLGDAHG